jgi:6-phosphofructokinase
MRIALSTGGSEAPGLNAVIRAAVLKTPKRVEVNHDTVVLSAQATGISSGTRNAEKRVPCRNREGC